MEFTEAAVQQHMTKRFTAFPPSSKFPVNASIYTDTLKAKIRAAIAVYPPVNDWHDVQDLPMEDQQDLWLLRDWLNANVFAFVIRTLQSASGSVKIYEKSRTVPPGFNLGDYYFYSFGSSKVTSDIDVTIEGPSASFMIACLEDAWYALTGKPSRVWDVEYYGDFLMFHEQGGDMFLNSRQFEPYKDRVMPYVGVSILRNGVDLNDPEIDEFIAKNPALNTPGWKEKAKELFQAVNNLDPQAMREQYYLALQKAEGFRDSPANSQIKRHVETFIALSHANMFRNENYLLPSTVIHVVRDIQAKSPKPETKQCELYSVKLASCALGKFTYLASALEQLGYRLRFRGQPAKIQKYQERLDDALAKAGTQGSQGNTGGPYIQEDYFYEGGKRKKRASRRLKKSKKRKTAKRRTRKYRR